jgi:hypothetical protein
MAQYVVIIDVFADYGVGMFFGKGISHTGDFLNREKEHKE